MKDRNKPYGLQHAFKEAYHQRDAAHVEPGWERQVMRQVRELGPLNQGRGWIDLIEGCFWKLAPVACILILVLSVALILQFDFISEAEIAKTFLEDSVDYSFLQMLGKS